MHLVSLDDVIIDIPRAGCTVRFESGETIWTENSYKYQPGDIDHLGAAAGFSRQGQWIDREGLFALTLFGI